MENKINIGELDTLITVYSCVITKGSVAEKQYSFSKHSDVYARIESDINESVANTNLESVDSVEAIIYKIPGMTTRWQLGIHGDRYTIEGIDPISRMSPLCRLSVTKLEHHG